MMSLSSSWLRGVGVGPDWAVRRRFRPPGGALAPPGCAEEDTTDSTETDTTEEDTGVEKGRKKKQRKKAGQRMVKSNEWKQ